MGVISDNREEDMREDLKRIRSEKSEAGFTLVELMVVVVILAMLAGVLGISVVDRVRTSRVKIAVLQISQFEGALMSYSFDMGRMPSTSEGLQALAQNPGGADNWKGPYLRRRLSNDPWGKAYIYRSPGGGGREFDILSVGPDGEEGTEDDICSWEDNN